jgi:hypothetical protein
MSAFRQKGKQGLGFQRTEPPPQPGTPAARALVSQRIEEDEDGQRRVHLMNCAMQGEFMKFDNLMERDLSWQCLLYDLTPSLLKFAVKSQLNVLATPDNLQRWRVGTFLCKLCGVTAPTQAHIFSSCKTALLQRRYKYRHDEVLRVLFDAVKRRVADSSAGERAAATDSEIRFHRAGEKPPPARRSTRTSILDSASDWQCIADLTELGAYCFPLNVALAEKKPDIVVWSPSTKQVVLLELTVPNEVNVAAARKRKLASYEELISDCRSNGYRSTCLTAEVGTRGFIAEQTQRDLLQLGIWSRQLKNQLRDTALRGSYAIYVHRNDREWCWSAPVRNGAGGAPSN